jgi:hypothetical protein
MNRFEHQWQKLTALARSAPADREAGAPYGFATRVTAQAATLPSVGLTAVFERFALRGLLVAAAFGVAAIAFNYSSLLSDSSDDYASADTVGELLSLS